MNTTPVPDYSPDPTLTPQQHRVINLLVEGNSITQAAIAENIHRNTIGYWRRTVPAFARELEFALREQRQYWHEQATRLAPQAIQTIFDSLTDPASSPSLRFRAAALIMKMVTDPGSKASKAFPLLPPEVEAVSGQMLSSQRKEAGVVATGEVATNKAAQNCTKGSPETTPETTPDTANDTPEIFDIAQAAKISVAAQNCTKPQPIHVAPKPGRNDLCHCGSGMKYKRCCANKPAISPLELLSKSA